ncbi:hypothetical protein ZOSMA_127G00090 [Zostera marina]|uniref:Uncharacterized protein n=1 Tax=Zostera marina TaxID=29655 RepID=A0A0K9PZY3_ZOSMR|nr:hypothetical protein ZOSMA_127G00090 [Zostera marina]
MGRGRVVLKRIENKINRQVTFAKRRNGLLKKAYELSVLCDAEVALIVFSNRGKLFEFCSSSSMPKTLERYQKCSYAPSETAAQVPSRETQNSHHEYQRLKARVEMLQRSQRNLLGEDLSDLSAKELDQLENQIEMSLRSIRSVKTQLMADQLNDLKRKEEMLQETNHALRRKEYCVSENICLQLAWENNRETAGSEFQQFDPHTTQPEGFFQPLGCDPSLQIGYHQISSNNNTTGSSSQNISGYNNINAWG